MIEQEKMRITNIYYISFILLEAKEYKN